MQDGKKQGAMRSIVVIPVGAFLGKMILAMVLTKIREIKDALGEKTT